MRRFSTTQRIFWQIKIELLLEKNLTTLLLAIFWPQTEGFNTCFWAFHGLLQDGVGILTQFFACTSILAKQCNRKYGRLFQATKYFLQNFKKIHEKPHFSTFLLKTFQNGIKPLKRACYDLKNILME